MSQKPASLIAYGTGATVVAALIYYFLGPSIHIQNGDEYIGSERKRFRGTGLVNSGNDCFINSVLQALTGLDVLHDHLSSQSKDPGSIETDGNGAGSCTTALGSILAALNEPSQRRTSLSASHFVRVLEQSIGQIFNRHQQDAQEFLQILYERLLEDHETRLKDASNEDNPSIPGSRKSFLPFEGQTTVQIECQKCQYVPKRKPETFSMLNLVVPDTQTSTLDQCFDLLFMRENIDDYLCPQCHKRDELAHYEWALNNAMHDPADVSDMAAISQLSEAIRHNPEATVQDLGFSPFTQAPRTFIHKSTQITKFPAVLTIHLSRSLYTQSRASTKNLATVKFPEYLVLGPLVHRHRYKLHAMIVHFGTHNSGHYVAFRRQRSRQPDDPKQTRVPEDSQATENVELDTILGTGDALSPIKPRRRANRQGPASLDGKSRKKSNKKDYWYRISDTRVSECTTDDVLAVQEGVYLLFYQHEE